MSSPAAAAPSMHVSMQYMQYSKADLQADLATQMSTAHARGPDHVTAILIDLAAGGKTQLLEAALKLVEAPEQHLLQPLKCGRTPLMAAAANGHAGTVDALLQPGFSPREQILYQACGTAEPDPAGSADPEHPEQGASALLLAAAGGHTEVVRLLLRHLQGYHEPDLLRQQLLQRGLRDRRSALHVAAEAGHAAVTALLLRFIPDEQVLLLDASRQTALSLSAGKGHLEVLDLLLCHSPKQQVLQTDTDGRNALMRAAEGGKGDVAAAVQRLLAFEPELQLQQQTQCGDTALTLACLKGDPEVVGQLLAFEPERQVLLQTKEGSIALTLACSHGHTDIVTQLLAFEPLRQLEHADVDGCTPLMRAAAQGHAAVVDLLLQRLQHLDPPALAHQLLQRRSSDGMTMLIGAARGGHAAVVELLLQSHAEEQVHVQDKEGDTALLCAAREGHAVVVDLLLRHQPEVQVLHTNASSWNALMHAAAAKAGAAAGESGAAAGEAGAAAAAGEAGASEGKASTTAARASYAAAAAEAGAEAVVRKLLVFEPSRQVAQRSDKGMTALMLAAAAGNAAVVAQLLTIEPQQQVLQQAQTGTIAFQFAAEHGHAAVVARLLTVEAERQVQHKAVKGSTARSTGVMLAAWAGHVAVVEVVLQHLQAHEPALLRQVLLQRGCGDRSASGATALMGAAHMGHVATVEQLLQYYPEEQVLAQDCTGDSALGYLMRAAIASEQRTQVMRLLLRHATKEQLLLTDHTRRIVLMRAACDCRDDFVPQLLAFEPEAQVLQRSGDGRSALMMVCGINRRKKFDRQVAVLQQLLAVVPQQQVMLRTSWNTALWCAIRNGHAAIVQQLLAFVPERQVLLQVEDASALGGNTALTLACMKGMVKIVKQLLAFEPDKQLAHITVQGRTALMQAVAEGSEAAAEVLIQQLQRFEQGPQRFLLLQHRPLDGSTPLMAAALRGWPRLVQLLLQFFPQEQVFLRDNSGSTALMGAATQGSTEVVQLLLQYSPEEQVALQDNKGSTALMRAASKAQEAALQLLLHYQPQQQVLHTDHKGMNALMLLMAATHTCTPEQLLAFEPERQVLQQSHSGSTALMLAAKHGNLKAVRQLLAFEPRRQVLLQDTDSHSIALTIAAQSDCWPWWRGAVVSELLAFEPGRQVLHVSKQGDSALISVILQGLRTASVLDSMPKGVILSVSTIMHCKGEGGGDVPRVLLRHLPQQQLQLRNAAGKSALELAAKGWPFALAALLPFVADPDELTQVLQGSCSSSNQHSANRELCRALLCAYGADPTLLKPHRRTQVYKEMRRALLQRRHWLHPLLALSMVCRGLRSLTTVSSPDARVLGERANCRRLRRFAAAASSLDTLQPGEREAALGVVRSVLRLQWEPDALSGAVREAVVQLALAVRPLQ